MSKLVIVVENHQQKYTVSEMRRRLAQVLSKLNGDQEVSFTFSATLENYQPASDASTNFATNMEKYNKLSPEQKHNTMHPVLGAPYNPWVSGFRAEDLAGAEPTVVLGPLAAPSND